MVYVYIIVIAYRPWPQSHNIISVLLVVEAVFLGQATFLQPRCFCLPVFILLKALPPVCMKYTARGESRVANIVRGNAESYICHETLTKSCIFHTNEAAVL